MATDLKDPTRKAVSDGVLGALPVLQMVRSKDVGSFRAANVKAIPKMGYTFTEGVEPTWTGESLVDRSSGMTEVVWQHQNVFTLKEDVIASDVVEKLVTIEIVDNEKPEMTTAKLREVFNVLNRVSSVIPAGKPCTLQENFNNAKVTFEPVDVKGRPITSDTVEVTLGADIKLACSGPWPGVGFSLVGLAEAGLFIEGSISAGVNGKIKWDGTVWPPQTQTVASTSMEGSAALELALIASATWGYLDTGAELRAGPKFKVAGTIEPTSKGLKFTYQSEFAVEFSGKYWYTNAFGVRISTEIASYKPDWGNVIWSDNCSGKEDCTVVAPFIWEFMD